MEVTGIDNDTRGWIMCSVSGIACVFGASIICVDILIRYIPSKKHFRIEESNVFLASSLSLSFGVMLFSALYSMLPSSKRYLEKGGFSPSEASWILLAFFVAGFLGIQAISRFLHHYIPSHVVDCDHTHEEAQPEDRSRSRHTSHARHHHDDRSHSPHTHLNGNSKVYETTPLLDGENGHVGRSRSNSGRPASSRGDRPGLQSIGSHRLPSLVGRRPSMIEVQKNRVMSFVKDTKSNCDNIGPCYGYSDPCGQECYRQFAAKSAHTFRTPQFNRTATGTHSLRTGSVVSEVPEEEGFAGERIHTVTTNSTRASRATSQDPADHACETDEEDLEAQHHHHVPENAFMSIGLQTSIAIALHKLPEGFITYATNHANPSLGFAVFMALFIHNITEGFAMALPLYLALKSRPKAMFWSSLLGGISQPLGAGIAALWFKVAGHTDHAPGFAVYGGMFAVTAGIMTSVALQLFVESLSLNHNRNLCIAFAFIGMSILAMSNALTAS